MFCAYIRRELLLKFNCARAHRDPAGPHHIGRRLRFLLSNSRTMKWNNLFFAFAHPGTYHLS
jgi:hypothetical protein